MSKVTVLANSPTKVVVLIDADGILFSAALKGETTCDGEQLQLLSTEAMYKDACRRIDEQIDWVAGDVAQVFICLSDRRNFRYAILDSYKGNRKGSPRPLALDALRTMIVDQDDFSTLLIEGLEADDVCGISAGRFRAAGYETVIISPDKDLLSIPGIVYTPDQKGGVTKAYRTQEDADYFHAYQTLVGDVCDNYKGCPGMGAVRAGKLLDQCKEEKLTLAQVWKEVVLAFLDAGLSPDDCLQQARVARILRFSDWDAVGKQPLLWNFPVEEAEGVRQAA